MRGFITGSHVLNDCHDVAFAVLEPGRFRAACGEDPAGTLLTGHVIALKFDTARFQLGHLAFDIAHPPERLAGIRRAGVWGGINEARRMAAELIRHSSGYFAARRESKLLFVEPPSARNVLGGNI